MGSKNKSVSSSEKSQGGKDKAKKDKKDHTEKKEVAVFINEDEANKIIKNRGRILVRKSGTEPKIRIMAESYDKSLILKCIKIIKRSIK